MIVYVVIGEYKRSLMSEVFGAFDSREKAIDCIQNVFKNIEYDEAHDTWKSPVCHDNIEFRIAQLKVQ